MASKVTRQDLTFGEATHVSKLDSHTYSVDLNEAFCIGAVPNGGYAASCMLAAARMHLSSRNQPDTLAAHFEYPGRSEAGPAIVVVDDVKLGAQLSTLHLTLWQGGLRPAAPWLTPAVSRRTTLAYTTHLDQQTFTGVTAPTAFEASPAAALPPPPPDLAALKARRGADDGGWAESRPPRLAAAVQRSLGNWRFFVPRGDAAVPGTVDMWMCRANGERIAQGAIPYVVDSFPFNLNLFLIDPELRRLMEAEVPRSQENDGARSGDAHEDRGRASLWFPSVAMSLEVKMALPEEGVEWLAMRVTSKQMKDGRFDLDVQVRDLDGELVALSHQVALILEMERNTGKKGRSPVKAAL